ncbi:P-loop containing nucleoside triphosphate hydrolase protein [Vararia minispora EC-137]|uniref:P-loop containing nucleoside triphosphate hydrolase protein n=1 Tax=Vararia minispora EC-137 TaxID=1314806 RepID=A0ACB8QJU0_9AGAM|nr:P-loop containing nucleoside triphosphate hydrolase protein [Vararia minispora EC-137]
MSSPIDNFAEKMTVKQAMNYLGLEDIRDILPGMEVHLLAHQAIGVAWMLMQERNDHHRIFPNARKPDPPYNGGILADDMGLGKTVQMIATMALNMPPVGDKVNKTTLIVVPAALLHQWKEELESKANDLFDVHIHHGSSKLKTVEAMRAKDVIITSYQTLNLDFGRPDDDMDDKEWEHWVQRYGGVLARMKWYRVVLDEAHFVRNRSVSTYSISPNTINSADIYGLLRFGRFRPWNDWPSFDEHVASVQLEDAPLASARAREILKPLFIRRRKDAQLEGRPLLELPQKHIDIVMEDFSEEERQIYDDYEKSAKIKINKFIKAGTIVKNSAYVLVMILRLRQLCGHPHLILVCRLSSRGRSLLNPSRAARVKRTKAKITWTSYGAKLNASSAIKKRFLRRARVVQLDFADDADDTELHCPACKDLFLGNNGRIIDCGHEVCQDCILNIITSPISHNGIFGMGDENKNMKSEQDVENAVAKGLRPCPVCNQMLDLNRNVFLSSAFEPSDKELMAEAHKERERARRPSGRTAISLSDDEGSDFAFGDVKPKVKAEKKPILKDNQKAKGEDEQPPDSSKDKGKGKAGKLDQRMLATWRRGDDNLEPSAKMLALIRLLQEADSAGDKTIVYSQWTSLLDLIEILFARYGIQSLRYDGKMSREQRDRTVVNFRKAGSQRVILISTKCGGVGLNLVAANRVVNMDLCWNYAAESQAYDRVHRLGQEKEVFVSRLVVKNTIEERMLRLQDVKTGLADAALGEGGGGTLHKMSVREIKLHPQLFGITRPQNENNQRGRDRQTFTQRVLPAGYTVAFGGGTAGAAQGLL